MIRCGWLADDPGFVGGAELTQTEFRAAAPEGVEVLPPDAPDLDVCVIHNCMSAQEVPKATRLVRYHHDLNRAPIDAELQATHIFTSPLHQRHYGLDGVWPNIPPALDLDRFKATANQNHRAGAVCVGRMSYGKGLEMLAQYPEPIDIYSSVPVASEGNARYRGATSDVSQTLAQYERFVFLPTALEPFGRALVEAWAAGLQIITNRRVGARWWIEENPAGLETAAEDFWRVVCGSI